jgi:hypothetical protein
MAQNLDCRAAPTSLALIPLRWPYRCSGFSLAGVSSARMYPGETVHIFFKIPDILNKGSAIARMSAKEPVNIDSSSEPAGGTVVWAEYNAVNPLRVCRFSLISDCSEITTFDMAGCPDFCCGSFCPMQQLRYCFCS